MCQGFHQPGANGVSRVGENDWNCRSGPPCRNSSWRTSRHDDVNVGTHEFSRRGQHVGRFMSRTELDDQIVAFAVSDLAQPLAKCIPQWFARHVCDSWIEQTDTRYSCRLLRPGGEWCGDYTGKRGHDEAPAVHYSIT